MVQQRAGVQLEGGVGQVGDELGQNVELTHSHGCVHLNPHERDEMIARGYLQQGVRFVCKKYEAHLLPDKARGAMMGK